MYIPKHFEIVDQEQIQQFLSRYLFGQLVSHVEGSLFATHLPFLYDREAGKLLCHVARANPQWQDIAAEEVLVILPGPHDYISPNWYRDSGVPTWNFQAVHVYGSATSFDEATKLQSLVEQITAQEEAQFTNPWQPDFPLSMLRGIVGIEIDISRIQAKFKLSQNRSKPDQRGVVEHLDERNPELAAAMRSSNNIE